MRILRLHLKNLHALRLEVTLDFTVPPLSHTGLFAITGDTGAGKSTLLDAITLALYGKLPRASEVGEILSYGAVECLAELEFSTRNELLRARWTTYRAGKKLSGALQAPRRELARWEATQQAFVVIAEKSREMDAAIEALTGLDYNRFRRSVLLAQGDFAAFLLADERERSELLEKITGAELYSEVSRAAYLRNKAAEGSLAEVQKQRAALDLLAGATLDSLTAQASVFEEQSTARLQQMEELRQGIRQWAEQHARQEERLRLQIQGEELAAVAPMQTTTKEKLDRHSRLRPLEPEWQRWLDLTQTVQRLSAQAQDAETRWQQREEAATKAAAELLEAQKRVDSLQATLQAQAPIWAAAERLDLQIAAQRDHTRMCQERWAQAQQTLLQQRERQEERQRRLATLAPQLAEVVNWLETHHAWREIPTAASGFLAAYGSWEQQVQASQTKHQAAVRVAEQIYAGQNEMQTRQHELNQKTLKLTELTQQFRALLPPSFPTNRSEALSAFFDELQRLRNRRQQLAQWQDLQTQYRRQLQALNRHEEDMQNLRLQELAIQKALLNADEARQAAQTNLTYKQAIYEQQLRMANYENDRAALAPGDPCPLCLSTDHPFRAHGVPAFLDRATLEYRQAQRDLEAAQAEFGNWLGAFKENAAALQPLERPVNPSTVLLAEMAATEKQMSQLASELADLPLSAGLQAEHPELLAAHEATLVEKTAVLETLQTLNQSWERGDAALRQLQTQVDQLQAQLQHLETQCQALVAEAAALEASTSAAEAHLLQQIAQWQLNAPLLPRAPLLAAVETARTQYLAQHALHQQVGEEQRQLLQLQAEAELQLATANQQVAAEIANCTQANHILQTLQAERYALMGEADPTAVAAAKQQELAAATATQQQLQNSSQAAREALIAAATARQAIQTQLDATQEHQAILALKLAEALPQFGLKSLEELDKALLSPQEEQELRSSLQRWQEDQADYQRRWAENKVALEALTVATADLPPLAELQTTLPQLQEEESRDQQEIGRIKELLRQQQDKMHQATGLDKQIEQLRHEARRWGKLNELIGAADGKKFRSFAQSLTLAKLVELANQHLQQLSGRYLIHQRSGDGLELEVIDTFQANNHRSMRSLSGGESFLVSLALALGLSSLAGKNTAIESLFIDEGFGSLDESSLEVAISTLENLQATGKTIGIISHVKELKERIGVQIQLHKQSDGFSLLRVSP